ncbi:efflux RND transporter periplasmic adaptor subunit [Geovibrio thiophilus]|uniref:Efflux RND transporter periplasmic adaptor subunit n=1 Tax=Geovibrio thiophilus TaxID=139438 RepID=A0A3R5XWX4_9BACT|nr:efflux RND transporter periplasmic adaptor subunit [Geovibrio thiophilus]QAR32646.1 efflux RND transporter periplasmic adaptor subunit [Geovibrio thiophilus]
MKNNILTISLVIAVFAAAAVFWMLKNPGKKETPKASVSAVLTVSEAAVTEAEWTESIKATGQVAAWQEAVIGTEISGQRLIAVPADVGDVVKKGQVLAKFNSETLLAEYAELEANWIAAESNRKRALNLKVFDAISEQSVEDYINKAAVAKAQMDAKALHLKYTNITAPDDGVISVRNATLGAVGAAGEELFRLIRQNRLEWRGELTANQAAHIVKGQSVILALPNGDKAEGTVRQIAPSFDPETRLITVFVDIKAGSGAQAGMYAEGQIRLGKRTALKVPAKSVVIRDGHSYVFSIISNASGAAVSRHEVMLGQTRGNEAQILSGLSKGMRIVLQGAGFLNDGDIVRISAEKGGRE